MEGSSQQRLQCIGIGASASCACRALGGGACWMLVSMLVCSPLMPVHAMGEAMEAGDAAFKVSLLDTLEAVPLLKLLTAYLMPTSSYPPPLQFFIQAPIPKAIASHNKQHGGLCAIVSINP